ncbi:MAG: ABC transporter permease [Alphaproteobacteria bacterium]|nr:ABC transporter permease [Alphaproteobacteria bacterium]
MTWLLRRLGISLVLIWVVATVVFLAIHMVPGDPAELLLSQGGTTPDAGVVEELREQLGLTKPLHVQYGLHMWRLLHFDLGQSMQDDSPVVAEIARRLPRTLELILAAGIMAVLIGIPTGTAAAMRRGGAFDRISSSIASLALAVPVFVVGTLMVMVFAQMLRWVPAGGFTPFSRDPAQHLALLAMPAGAIGIGLSAVVFRMTRAAVLDVMLRDYVRTARAKGVTPSRILVRHVVRTALMPVVTILALQLGTLLGGTVLVEFVFNWPGLSGLLVSAVNARDYPLVVGIITVISVLFVGLNLAVDVLYGLLDPRVRR